MLIIKDNFLPHDDYTVCLDKCMDPSNYPDRKNAGFDRVYITDPYIDIIIRQNLRLDPALKLDLYVTKFTEKANPTLCWHNDVSELVDGKLPIGSSFLQFNIYFRKSFCSYQGGLFEIETTDGEVKSFDPNDNQLYLFLPGTKHRVTDIKGENPNRYTLGGYINYALH